MATLSIVDCAGMMAATSCLIIYCFCMSCRRIYCRRRRPWWTTSIANRQPTPTMRWLKDESAVLGSRSTGRSQFNDAVIIWRWSTDCMVMQLASCWRNYRLVPTHTRRPTRVKARHNRSLRVMHDAGGPAASVFRFIRPLWRWDEQRCCYWGAIGGCGWGMHFAEQN